MKFLNWLKSLFSFKNTKVAIDFEQDLEEKIRLAQLEYNQAVLTQDVIKIAELSKILKTYKKELGGGLVGGAVDCPVCGGRPFGMKRLPGKYEVGCLHDSELSICGESAKEAVKIWNHYYGGRS